MSSADDRSATEPGASECQGCTSAAPESPRRFKLVVAYDGALFHGWQRQLLAVPGSPPAIGQGVGVASGAVELRTVAGVLESAIARTVRMPVRVVGASRTDAGVHALGQVAHFDAETRIPMQRMAEAINSRLPEDVEVRSCEAVGPGFDAIRGAVMKQYRYRIHLSRRRPLDRRLYVWHCWRELDVARMNQAAAALVGEHDFAAFTAAGHGRTTTVRAVSACEVERSGDEVHIVVRGKGFLYNMVRIIAGTLTEIGRGAMTIDDVRTALSGGDRRRAGPTLPASGLWLEWIRYDEGDVGSDASVQE